MTSLGNTDELSIFDTCVVKDFYEFQWNSYAKHIHYFGSLIHLISLTSYIIYVYEIYLYRRYEYRLYLIYIMIISKIFPLIYDTLQLTKQGPKQYFQDPWNYLDQAYIWIGIANIIVQRYISDILNPASQILMILHCLIMLGKTFFFLRIFESLSFLVSMINSVITDLIPFIFIYSLLLLMFAICLGIIDWCNFEFQDDIETRRIQYTATGPDKEYMIMNKLFARVIAVMRISIGDFGFDSTQYMNRFQNAFYWIIFLVICTMTCIIFMNFIIAEVSASYQNVKDSLHVKLLQERGQLINEAEDILRARYKKKDILKWTKLFPKYIIKRELDE